MAPSGQSGWVDLSNRCVSLTAMEAPITIVSGTGMEPNSAGIHRETSHGRNDPDVWMWTEGEAAWCKTGKDRALSNLWELARGSS